MISMLASPFSTLLCMIPIILLTFKSSSMKLMSRTYLIYAFPSINAQKSIGAPFLKLSQNASSPHYSTRFSISRGVALAVKGIPVAVTSSSASLLRLTSLSLNLSVYAFNEAFCVFLSISNYYLNFI